MISPSLIAALIEGILVSTNTTCCLLSSAFVRVALSVFSGVPSIWASESGTVVIGSSTSGANHLGFRAGDK